VSGWIGVDLDGTLARYEGWQGELHIGAPIQPMVNRIRRWLTAGIEVRIFTARVCQPNIPGDQARASVEEIRSVIQDYTELLFGVRLKVTNEKDFGMIELWDDRAVRVRPNTGERCCER
jgi:hypothetical protein